MALAVVSVLVTVGAGVTAGVVFAQGDSGGNSGTLVRGSGSPRTTNSPSPTETGFDYSGWKLVNGMKSSSGETASYRLPSKGWTTYASDYQVSYADQQGKRYAEGHALANYYGNKCSEKGEKLPGGWTVLAEPEQSGDLKSIAEVAVRRWARGYGTNETGTTAKMTGPVSESVTLADGTPAARAQMTLDMTVFTSACLPAEAEVMVTTMDTPDGAKSLVQARYVMSKGITDEQWEAISLSLAP